MDAVSPTQAPERSDVEARSVADALDLMPHARNVAGEAWALMARLLLREGKPRFPWIAAELELSPPQAIALRVLDAPRPMGDLATAMHCDPSNVTGIVDRLEERGLVRRVGAAHDRRVKLIEATGDGMRLRDELNRRLAEPPRAIVDMREDDVRALRDLLRKALGE